ncbi:tetratricopeptide repeat protein [Flavihumibacter petaseus]|uniref:Uncharacterized protein n=1 Tax=Flavihumibacter petaseus NBRC 106054 TaxID=1220578 RepID=A0A0E9MXS8_9BACT|nr:tetratricopeptide repeat protein [Flavihumibacter petaseus]GAO42522.1 hypothetical protein FPE01S_01_15370 [Flavihumibacter petaseus NBRC 106054]
MSTDLTLSRIDILLQQQRFADAEKELRDLLATDANNIQYLGLLAEVNLQQDKFDVAGEIIARAIGISPDSPHLYYLRARIFIQQDDYTSAESSLRQALALDPYDADYFAMLGNVRLAKKDYEGALEQADEALSLDPENLLGLNIRSTALLKLNRKEESFTTIEGALREDPNNAYTHANYGWALLEKGDHKKAMEHFREALKTNPNFTYAQSGMLEAIKASNPVYRLFLKYSFFMSNLTSRYQWGVIIGIYVAMRVLRSIAKSNETLRPYLAPLIIAVALVAFSTWIMTPISNLFLRFNRYGQLLLDKKERMSSNVVAAALGTFLAGVALYFALSDARFLAVAVFGFAMMLPGGVMFSATKPKNVLFIYTIAMAAVGVLAIIDTFATGELFNMWSGIFVIAFIAFQWIGNFFLIKEGKA